MTLERRLAHHRDALERELLTLGELSGGGANTNVIQHAGKIYAIVEAGGNPVELDDELFCFFGGGLLRGLSSRGGRPEVGLRSPPAGPDVGRRKLP